MKYFHRNTRRKRCKYKRKKDCNGVSEKDKERNIGKRRGREKIDLRGGYGDGLRKVEGGERKIKTELSSYFP